MYVILLYFFVFKQKTAYEMRISDWSSDVCSSDLGRHQRSITSRSTGSNLPAISPFSLARNAPIAPPSPTISQIAPSDSALAASRRDRKSVVSGKSVSVRVDLGGRRIIKKKQTYIHTPS